MENIGKSMCVSDLIKIDEAAYTDTKYLHSNLKKQQGLLEDTFQNKIVIILNSTFFGQSVFSSEPQQTE